MTTKKKKDREKFFYREPTRKSDKATAVRVVCPTCRYDGSRRARENCPLCEGGGWIYAIP
jgi:RecJ-like exonuclease